MKAQTSANPVNRTLNSIVSATDLRKSYGDLTAVDGLSFEVRRGESFGLLGPNGAGKTTTISMLVGLLKPDAGTVWVGGSSDSGAAENGGDPLDPEIRRAIGVAPQALSLYGELTARENLRFFGQLYGLAGKTLNERVQWCLDFAGLTDRKNDRVATFSGGMRRRLNIAVALVHQPSVLLLDEPTVGVDPQSRNHIFECIQQLQNDGMTILYTTHYMEEAQRLCDRVAIVDRGKLLALDSVANLVGAHGGTSVVEASLKPETIAKLDAGELELPGQCEAGALRFESENPLEEVAQLTGQGVQFQTLRIAEPDLESVFLSLTGRSLRD